MHDMELIKLSPQNVTLCFWAFRLAVLGVCLE